MLLENHNAIESGGYQISNSLRFQASSSSYLSRTPSVAGNRKTWTWSAWVKLGNFSEFPLINSYVSTNDFLRTGITNNQVYVQYQITGVYNPTWISNAVFRDPSAWYHFVIVWDTTQASAVNYVKVYVNGVQQTLAYALNGGGTVPQNTDGQVNSTIAQRLGINAYSSYADGYITEINHIDGQALTPSSFGEFDSVTGQWVAKKYTGTYGTNGFYLPFSNGTSTTTLGNDGSGNANHWTLNNFTRSPGTTDCWMYDVPSGNGSVVGGTQPNSNYAVLNPLKKFTANFAITNSNLKVSDASNASCMAVATIRTGSSGKYYFEVHDTVISSSLGFIGVTTEANADANSISTVGYYRSSGTIANLAGTLQTSGAAYAGGNVIGVAIDVDNGTCQFYKNGVAQGATPSFTFTAGTPLVPFISTDNTAGTKTFDVNFGQRSFTYTPPSGFKALCTANLPAATIKKGNTVFDATLYTGNATARSITNTAGFAPDMVWVKSRSSATDNYIWDTVRGNFGIVTNSTAAEFAGSQVVPNSTGFALENSSGVNANGATYVGWQWDAGSSTVTNTNGTISSQVRANPTAGVSVVTYTGTGANATVGHGLGVAPKMVITKGRNNVDNWIAYHANLSSTAHVLMLNSTSAQFSSNQYTSAPSSSVLNLGVGGSVNASGLPFVAYCFAEITGYSRFGSYTGNGSADGPFVYTGFRPKFVMVKCSSVGGAGYSWFIFDSARGSYNVATNPLFADSSAAEGTSAIDIVSNGFKFRDSGASVNGNGNTYVYACFAESPFQNSNAR